MKEIIVSYDIGIRLYPLTMYGSTQFLSLYKNPMTCFPISNLLLSAINDTSTLTTPSHIDFSKINISKDFKLQINFSDRDKIETNLKYYLYNQDCWSEIIYAK
jgi:dTDP-glucose pyrophosphorylase